MFDKNFEDFVKEAGLNSVGKIVADCPDNSDTYSKSRGVYFKRGKQLYYSSDEINVKYLECVYLAYIGESIGDSFKDRLYRERAIEFLEKIK